MRAMARRARVAALLALLGMSGLSLGAAIVLSLSCCSPTCEQCPVSFCKVSTADKARKVESAQTTAAAAPVLPRITAPAPETFWTPPRARAFSSGYVRPMRN